MRFRFGSEFGDFGGGMASSEGVFSAISVAAVVEDVLRRHGTRLSDTGLASRKAEEAGEKRFSLDPSKT